MSRIISIKAPGKTRHQHRCTIAAVLRRLSQKPWPDDELSAVIYEGRRDEFSVVLAQLTPHFADIRIRRMIREPALWEGAYGEFMGED